VRFLKMKSKKDLIREFLKMRRRNFKDVKEFLNENFPYRLVEEVLKIIETKQFSEINIRIWETIKNSFLIKKEKGIYLFGKAGIGKTVSVILSVAKLYQVGVITTVKYISLYDINSLDCIERVFEDYNELHSIWHSFKYDILIVDDINPILFADRRNLMMQFWYNLYEIPSKFNILISNRDLKEMGKGLKYVDGVISSRFFSFFSEVVGVDGENLRNLQLKKKLLSQ
jgi:DNA replication protein DnaC